MNCAGAVRAGPSIAGCFAAGGAGRRDPKPRRVLLKSGLAICSVFRMFRLTNISGRKGLSANYPAHFADRLITVISPWSIRNC